MNTNERRPQTSAEEEDNSQNRRGGLLIKVAAGGLATTALTAAAIGVGVEAKGHSGNTKEVSAKNPAATAVANPGHEATPAKSPDVQPPERSSRFEVMGKTYDSTDQEVVGKVAKGFEVPSNLSPAEKNDKILKDFNAIINTRDDNLRKRVIIPAAKRVLLGKGSGGDADGILPSGELFSSIEHMAHEVDAFNASLPKGSKPYGLTLSVNKSVDGEGVTAMPYGTRTDITTLLKTSEFGGHDKALDGERVFHYILSEHGGVDKIVGGRIDKTSE